MPAPTPEQRQTPDVGVPRISVCRGCCCGTSTKRPDIDHQAQRDRLDELAGVERLRWRETECLGPCDDANVFVVHPSPRARAAGARTVWLARIGNDELEAIISWVSDGGPGHATVPARLHPHLIPAHRTTGR